MVEIREHIDVQVILNTPVAPTASFGVGLMLVDDVQVPVDKRFIIVTPSDWDTLDPASHFYKYANVYFAQKRQPDTLVLGRLIETASLPYWYSGPALETTIATWNALVDGEFNLDDGTLDEDFSAMSFAAITTLAQALPIIQAKLDLAAVVIGVVVSLDLFNRMVFTNPDTGETLVLADLAVPVGTGMSTILDASNGASVASSAVETMAESTTAISDMGQGFYNINSRLGTYTDTERLDFASWIETQNYLTDFVSADPLAYNSSSEADLGFKLQALGLDRSLMIYSEKTLEYPDAAANGCVIPALEGTTSWSWETLKLVTDSGNPDPLSSTKRAVLKTKNYNWIENLEGNTILYPGITSGNEEKRIMLGKDWYEFTIQSRIFLRQLSIPLNAFDNVTLTALEGIVRETSEEAVDRGIIVDTVLKPLIITIPDADDITDAMKATHKLTILDMFSAWINSAINDYKLVGTWNA